MLRILLGLPLAALVTLALFYLMLSLVAERGYAPLGDVAETPDIDFRIDIEGGRIAG